MAIARENNGWTGGQYSLYRACLGAYLMVHFVQLIPWAGEVFSNRGVLPDGGASPLLHLFPNVMMLSDSPAAATALVVIAAIFSGLLLVGWHDRLAAAGVWYIMACLLGRNPLITNPGLPYIGLLLVVHALIPGKPYGALSARGRPDPDGGWRLPQPYFALVWVLMAVGYSYSGYTKLVSPSWLDGTAIEKVLQNPLARPGIFRDAVLALPPPLLKTLTWSALAMELLFTPLALVRLLRPWVWAAMLAMHLSLMLLIDFTDLSLGMVMLHLFTFNPAWVAPAAAGTVDRVFYDGHCGLCHRAVRFMLAEGRGGKAFVFTPLQSERLQQVLSEEQRRGLPDSIVVLTADGRLHTRSTAVIHAMGRMGGVWRILGGALRLVPRAVRDAGYDAVARVRHRLWRRPTEACPLMPAGLRTRFEL
ncbi:MAG: DCC1-like thiol-disulfide oxidoreductase family protein [Planctomycetes bacterium]|nr:DCC1-like thiol-disulfide oxidoreductase family protein [Planctomycetota bacterium]